MLRGFRTVPGMPLPGHQKILQSAAQVLFLLPCSLTEAAPGGQACGHSGGEGLGWPRGLSSRLLELTSPGHTLLTSPQLLALHQETPPPRIWLIRGKVRRDGFKAGPRFRKRVKSELWLRNSQHHAAGGGGGHHGAAWSQRNSSTRTALQTWDGSTPRGASSIPKEHNTSPLSLDTAAKPSKRFCAKTALSARCLCSAQRQRQGLKHPFK